MRFYEVFLGLYAHGRPLGRACVQTIAECAACKIPGRQVSMT